MTAAALRPAPDLSVAPELRRVLDRTLDRRAGLIRRILESPPCPRSGLFMASAQFPRPDYYRTNRPTSARCVEGASGAGFSRSDALWATVGEAIERYCGSIYRPDDLHWATARHLGEDAIDLAPLIRTGRQEVVPLDPDGIRGWLHGVDLLTGKPRWIPAQMGVLAYQFHNPGEVLVQSDSTGLACGRNLSAAALAGLCECLERDAFAATWLLDHAPPRVHLSDRTRAALRPETRQALDALAPDITLLSLSASHGVHVIVCLYEPAGQGGGVVGAAAAPSPLRAIEKSVIEALHGWSAARLMRPVRLQAAIDALEDPFDHLLRHLDAEHFAVVRRMARSRDILRIDAGAEDEVPDLAAILSSLVADGLSPCLLDLTTTDVQDLGLSVAKVIVPGLQPLVFGPACAAAPDRRRLRGWAQRWGRDSDALNPHPHPFP